MSIENTIDGKLYCQSCKQKTNHGYILKHEINQLTEGEWDFQWEAKYYITQCLGCDSIAFLRVYGDEDMLEQDWEGNFVHYTEKQIYPEEPTKSFLKNEVIHTVKDFEKAPESIVELYNQVVSSVNSRHYLLCAVGLRMIVEAICKETEVVEGFVRDEEGKKIVKKKGNEAIRNNLEGKINGLQTAGIIVEKQAETLHQIRHLGNVSAHELEVPKRGTIRKGIEIIENMITNIFELEKYIEL